MNIFSHFNTALHIIQQYSGKPPLHHYLKQYFANNKKHGSKDRKAITHICYCYYRIGNALLHVSEKEKALLALFLCNPQPGLFSALFENDWLQNWNYAFEQRLAFAAGKYTQFNQKQIFRFSHQLSEEIDAEKFSLSHLQQPSLFIRVRPGFGQTVQQKLQTKSIAFKEISANCFELNSSTKLEETISLNKEAVVQDYSSQQTALLLQTVQAAFAERKSAVKIWDCCAASGGKSILAKDVFKNISLTVSDIRASIISNLHKRFREAGISNYASYIADVSKPVPASVIQDDFDCIICDAPCSGSGTWSRSPEQLSFFSEAEIAGYASLQKSIAANTIPHLRSGGYFLYITCSVFKKENEEVAAYIQQQWQLHLLQQQWLIGYDKDADTMFAALFKK